MLAVTRARRRREVLVYAWLMPASTVVQAVIGGITVLTGLLWWTVAIHLLASMTMVWLAVLLYVKIGEPDDGVPRLVVPKALRGLTLLSGAVLAAVLVTGTLVTGAGPHAGDKSIAASGAPACRSRSPRWCTRTRRCCGSTWRCWSGWASGWSAVHAPRSVRKRLVVLVALVCAQAVRRGRAVLHRRAGRAGGRARRGRGRRARRRTAALWASMRERTEAQPLEG